MTERRAAKTHRRGSGTSTPRPFVRKWSLYTPRATSDGGESVPHAASTFRVVSFNVLAEYIVARDDTITPDHAWKYAWSYRCSRLLREILSWRPHVICLQEVDHFEDYFEPKLIQAGYCGVYKKRTGESTHDGCAIFVLTASMTILEVHPLEYFVSENDLLDRHNIALQVVVEWQSHEQDTTAVPKRFIVANTHLLFNPGRGDVKLAQLERLLSSLTTLRTPQAVATEATEATAAPLLPVILCGDFNLSPHSALYELLSRGTLDASGLCKTYLSGQNMDTRQKNALYARDRDEHRHYGHGTAFGRFQASRAKRTHFRHFPEGTSVSHSLPLASAYAQLPTETCTGEPKFTTFHHGSKGTVDYMWFTTDTTHCHGVVEMVPAGQLFAAKALPTKHHASDHLALVADFSLL